MLTPASLLETMGSKVFLEFGGREVVERQRGFACSTAGWRGVGQASRRGSLSASGRGVNQGRVLVCLVCGLERGGPGAMGLAVGLNARGRVDGNATDELERRRDRVCKLRARLSAGAENANE